VTISKSVEVKDAILRDDTIRRLGGDGAGYAMTWTGDGRQLVSVLDGPGWPENPTDEYYCTRIFTVSGGPQDPGFTEVSGYPNISLYASLYNSAAFYYGWDLLAVNGRVYQYLSSFKNTPYIAARSPYIAVEETDRKSDLRYAGAKLIYSPDNGRTWCNQDGSTPVRLESQADQSRATLTFFEESQHAFSVLSFLQMGRDYEDNIDGYVYVYSPNGDTDGTINELVMFRVPKAEVLNRGAYEFYAGLRSDGSADWVGDIDARKIVHTFPRGWVNESIPHTWIPSVSFNRALGLYMMLNWGSGSGRFNAAPGYLGLWTAPKPWGPWTQVLEQANWTPAGDPSARAYMPRIAPKWISADGRSLWITWSDRQGTAAVGETFDSAIYHARGSAEFKRVRFTWRQYHPYFSLNTQRLDLITD
jgi:uncharacterized protein DUF4185